MYNCHTIKIKSAYTPKLPLYLQVQILQCMVSMKLDTKEVSNHEAITVSTQERSKAIY